METDPPEPQDHPTVQVEDGEQQPKDSGKRLRPNESEAEIEVVSVQKKKKRTKRTADDFVVKESAELLDGDPVEPRKRNAKKMTKLTKTKKKSQIKEEQKSGTDEEDDMEPTESSSIVWNLKEKEALLQALKHIPMENHGALAKAVGTRSEEQVRSYIAKLQSRHNFNMFKYKYNMSPLEMWIKATKELLGHSHDYSDVVSDLLRSAAFDEAHEDLKFDEERVRWSCLYSYLASMLDGTEPPELTDLESAILLDLLETLSSDIQNPEMEKVAETLRHRFYRVKSETNHRWARMWRILQSTPGNVTDRRNVPALREHLDETVLPKLYTLNPWNIATPALDTPSDSQEANQEQASLQNE